MKIARPIPLEQAMPADGLAEAEIASPLPLAMEEAGADERMKLLQWENAAALLCGVVAFFVAALLVPMQRGWPTVPIVAIFAILMCLLSLLISIGEMRRGTIVERMVGVRRLRSDLRPFTVGDWLLRHWTALVPVAYFVTVLMLGRAVDSFDTTRAFVAWIVWHATVLAIPAIALMVGGMVLRQYRPRTVVVRLHRPREPRGFEVVRREAGTEDRTTG